MIRRRERGERGVVGGGDAVAFGMLILVAGTLAFAHIWSIVDTRMALDAAAREYLRTYTEQSDAATAGVAADRAARSVVEQRRAPLRRMSIAAPDPADFGPCAVATVRLSATVPRLRIPFIDGLGATSVDVVHSELIDPHREVIPGANHDPTTTDCAR